MPLGDELSAEGRAALGEYLLLMADDELVIGHRDSEWCAFAPLIEEDVAFASIAQDEISHAALFYELIESMRGLGRDQLAFGRPASEMRNATLLERENGDWAFTIARHYLYDLADELRLEQLAKCHLPTLRAVAERIRREEHYHLEHGAMWLVRLSRGGSEARSRVQAALERVVRESRGLFQPMAWEQILVAEGVIAARPSHLYQEFRERAGTALATCGLRMPPDMPPGEHPRGRTGGHTPELRELLQTMGEVWRSDPTASW